MANGKFKGLSMTENLSPIKREYYLERERERITFDLDLIVIDSKSKKKFRYI